MLLDANLLLFAEDESSPFHDQACAWVTAALNGDVRVGLPWPSLLAFVRIRRGAGSRIGSQRQLRGSRRPPTDTLPCSGH
jgi:predicted nucleic acid-binding protein